MSEEKQIRYKDKIVGTAKINIEGLYYRFECRCNFPNDGIYRLRAYCNNNSVPLGVCVPREGGFGATTKIPINKLGAGEICVIAEINEQGCTQSIYPEKPFSAIADLDKATLCPDGIRIKD